MLFVVKAVQSSATEAFEVVDSLPHKFLVEVPNGVHLAFIVHHLRVDQVFHGMRTTLYELSADWEVSDPHLHLQLSFVVELTKRNESIADAIDVRWQLDQRACTNLQQGLLFIRSSVVRSSLSTFATTDLPALFETNAETRSGLPRYDLLNKLRLTRLLRKCVRSSQQLQITSQWIKDIVIVEHNYWERVLTISQKIKRSCISRRSWEGPATLNEVVQLPLPSRMVASYTLGRCCSRAHRSLLFF